MQSRYVPGAVEGIRSALSWAGLSYDFGKVKPKPSNRNSDDHTLLQKAPGWMVNMVRIVRYVMVIDIMSLSLTFWQSERLDLYRSYAHRLLEVCTVTAMASLPFKLLP